jgi:hypothetical protein
VIVVIAMTTRIEQEIATVMITVKFCCSVQSLLNVFNSFLYFLGLSANKLNTFHKNTLPDNIVHGLKTINLASNPYICDCSLIWFIKWLKNTKIKTKKFQAFHIFERVIQRQRNYVIIAKLQ